ncbi:unnamed protein product [Rhizoctonia solani]|uniref:Uncharacterized protein n=1 Tax=Rhizoctonia solani TaxID=456999 RepID=A0A8H3HBK2_9AGAM|nr:unnamed protein product [Rhizoctonia solani]
MAAPSKRKRTARNNLKKARIKLREKRVGGRGGFSQGIDSIRTKHYMHSEDMSTESKHVLQEPYVPNVLLWDDRGAVCSELVENSQVAPETIIPHGHGATSEYPGIQLCKEDLASDTYIGGTIHEVPSTKDPGLQDPYLVSVDETKYSVSLTGTDEPKQPAEGASMSYLRRYKETFRASKKAIATTQFSIATGESWVVEGVSLEDVLHTHGQRLGKEELSGRWGDTTPSRYLVIKLD